MLNHVHIRNLAVVDEVEVELAAGLTVLTGETGAGKSILVDALGLALGERADSDAVRAGAKRAEITASFILKTDSKAVNWLQDNDLDEDSTAPDGGIECVLRRVVTTEGRSRGYINGNPAPMQSLRELGGMLVDICGQQAHQSLSKPDNQRTLVDQHGGHLQLVEKHRTAYQAWQSVQNEYTELDASQADQASRIDLLKFQVQELEALNATDGELEQLELAHKRAANANRIQEDASAALQMLYENEAASAYDLTSRAHNQLRELAELDPELASIANMLTEAEIQINEAADNLRHYLDSDASDSTDFNQMEARLGAMHDLARKHRVKAAELPALTERLSTELNKIEHADGTLEELQQKLAELGGKLAGHSKKLSAARKKAAKSLAAKVTSNIQQLGMPEGKFIVQLNPLEKPSASGADRIEFQVAINPGLAPGALAKVASGGELSRVSLAIQVAASDASQNPTMIFDEVDAGVGGSTADIVGEKLRDLAASCQVLCVTHLPQVASKGHEQFRVSKLSDGQSTRTRVAHLTRDERVEELARMLGGAEITSRTRDHAEEMLATGSS